MKQGASLAGKSKIYERELIKSPLNYTGGKYKLLPQILPLFPKEIDTFVDLFGGGFNVGANVEASHIIYNEYDSKVFKLIKSICSENPINSFKSIIEVVNKYGLSKINEEGFYKLREDYNNSSEKKWYELYAIITHAFNYQIRFNKSGGYNMPFGRNRSSFSIALQKKFKIFSEALNKRDIEFHNNSYGYIKNLFLDANDLVYCDPPYLITMASYNEQDGWNESREQDLLDKLDGLNKNGVRFALSNVVEHKGKENTILKKWSLKYNIHYLNHNYSNCSYHGKDKSKDSTVEVLITNYQNK